MNQVDLNIKLLNACEKEKIDFEEIKNLLKLGANPLGTISRNDKYEYLYNELIFENKHLYELTKLFLESGMRIQDSNYMNDGNDTNPMWDFAFRCDSTGIKTLKLLLDNNLDVESSEILVDHIYTDYIFLDEAHACDEELDEEYFKSYEYAMKMILLCASYKNILNGSEYIRNMIDFEQNSSDTNILRNYDNYYMIEQEKSLLFYNKNDNKVIWEISIKE